MSTSDVRMTAAMAAVLDLVLSGVVRFADLLVKSGYAFSAIGDCQKRKLLTIDEAAGEVQVTPEGEAARLAYVPGQVGAPKGAREATKASPWFVDLSTQTAADLELAARRGQVANALTALQRSVGSVDAQLRFAVALRALRRAEAAFEKQGLQVGTWSARVTFASAENEALLFTEQMLDDFVKMQQKARQKAKAKAGK